MHVTSSHLYIFCVHKLFLFKKRFSPLRQTLLATVLLFHLEIFRVLWALSLLLTKWSLSTWADLRTVQPRTLSKTHTKLPTLFSTREIFHRSKFLSGKLVTRLPDKYTLLCTVFSFLIFLYDCNAQIFGHRTPQPFQPPQKFPNPSTANSSPSCKSSRVKKFQLPLNAKSFLLFRKLKSSTCFLTQVVCRSFLQFSVN